jgi:hypothetical protein
VTGPVEVDANPIRIDVTFGPTARVWSCHLGFLLAG